MNDFFYDPWTLFLLFLIPGTFLGALYDGFRILRIARTDQQGRVIPRLYAHFGIKKVSNLQSEKKLRQVDFWLVFTEDFIFCLIASLTELLLFFHLNGGVIRIPGLLFSAIGFFIYRFTLGKMVIGTTKWIIRIARKLLYLLLLIFCTPIVLIKKQCRKITNVLKNRKGKIKHHEK